MSIDEKSVEGISVHKNMFETKTTKDPHNIDETSEIQKQDAKDIKESKIFVKPSENKLEEIKEEEDDGVELRIEQDQEIEMNKK
jgi:hypothetical protein